MQKELHIVTTDIINKVTDKIAAGNKLISDAKEELNIKLWYDNEEGIRKAGILFEMSQFEKEEYLKCKNDIFYFAETYCKIKLKSGETREIVLRDYQKEIIDMYVNNRFSLLASAPQMGKTISAAIVILHYCLFNNDKNVMIVANKHRTVGELVSKIKDIYKLLPFFIKKGVISYNKSTINFENGCRIISERISKSSKIGFTIDFLYFDEFAHAPHNIIGDYYKTIISSMFVISDSRLIITSTPNGNNLFYKLLEDSERDENDSKKNLFKSMRVYYDAIKARKDTLLKLPLCCSVDKEIENVLFINFLRALYGYDIIKDKNIYIIKNDDKKETQLDFVKNIEINGKRIDSLFNVTNWKYEEMKLIGNENDFKREYELNFEI